MTPQDQTLKSKINSSILRISLYEGEINRIQESTRNHVSELNRRIKEIERDFIDLIGESYVLVRHQPKEMKPQLLVAKRYEDGNMTSCSLSNFLKQKKKDIHEYWEHCLESGGPFIEHVCGIQGEMQIVGFLHSEEEFYLFLKRLIAGRKKGKSEWDFIK